MKTSSGILHRATASFVFAFCLIAAHFAGAATPPIPTLRVTETINRSLLTVHDPDLGETTYGQVESTRLDYTVVLPLNSSMNDFAIEDGMTLTVGDHAFDASGAPEATVDLAKRRAVFQFPDDPDFPTGDIGTVTMTWTDDKVTIVGSFRASYANPMFPEGSEDEKGNIAEILAASVSIGGGIYGERAGKQWNFIMLSGTAKFTEKEAPDETTYTSGKRSVTGVSDTVRPTVKILTPRADVRSTDGSTDLEIKGTAGDNIFIDTMFAQVDNGELQDVTFEPIDEQGKNVRWTFDATDLQPGAHTITVYALDVDALVSVPASRKFTNVKTVYLTVTVEGSGTVPGAFRGRTAREVGKYYEITAKPAAKQAFLNWTGDLEGIETAGTKLGFVMPDLDEATLTANFLPSKFPLFKGDYVLQLAPNEEGAGDLRSRGTVEMSLSAAGVVTGKFFFWTSTTGVPFRGEMRADGSVVVAFLANGEFYRLTLYIDLEGATAEDRARPAIYGDLSKEVYNPDTGYEIRPIADVAGFRTYWDTKRSIAAGLIGNYTMTFNIPDLYFTADGLPVPNGYATATISKPGSMRATGVIAGGEPFTYGGKLSADGQLFVRMPTTYGLATGTITVTKDDSSAPKATVDAALVYEQLEDSLDVEGKVLVTYGVEFAGEQYLPPAKGKRIFESDTGEGSINVTGYTLIDDPDLGRTYELTPFDRNFTLSTANTVTLGDGEPTVMALSFDKATGRFSGSFTSAGKRATFNGVVLQDAFSGVGQISLGNGIWTSVTLGFY